MSWHLIHTALREDASFRLLFVHEVSVSLSEEGDTETAEPASVHVAMIHGHSNGVDQLFRDICLRISR